MDPELAAMRAIVAALEPLAADARARVITSAAAALAFTAHALAELERWGITPEQWIAANGYEGVWTGDRCGCSDDRCIGHHHFTEDDCGCLPVMAAEFLRESGADAATIADAEQSQSGDVMTSRGVIRLDP